MKKVNGMTVYEPEDPCALDEYSEQLEKDLTAKFNEIEGENEQESADILTLQKKVTSLEQETEEQQGQITELQNKVIVLEDQIPTGEASGNPIYINDSSNLEASIRLNGGDKQETSVQGKNYFTGNKINSGTEMGVAYSFNNSTLHLNGTTTANGNIVLDKTTKIKIPAGTYTYTIKQNSGTFERPTGNDFAIYLMSGSNNFITGDYANSGISGSNLTNNSGLYSKTFTITEEKELYIRISASVADVVFNNLELEIQIESGSTYTGMEQFIPNSPSPDYLSKVETVGSNINEFDKSASPIYVAGSTATEIENGIRIATISSNQGLFCLYKIKDITNFKGKTFTVKANWIASASNKGRIILGLCDSNGGNRISGADTYVSGEAISYTIPDTLSTSTYLALWLYSNANGTAQAGDYVDYTDIKIEEGNKATAYSPYNMGSVEIDVINKNLAEIELGDINPTTGKENAATKVFRSNYIRVKNGATYVWSVNKTLTNPLNIRLYDIDKNYIGYASFTGQKTYTITNGDIAYLRVRCDLVGEETIDGLIVQIEEGNTATDIVKHQQQTKIMPIQQEMLEGDYIEDVEHHGWKKKILNGTDVTDGGGTFAEFQANGNIARTISIPDLLVTNVRYDIKCEELPARGESVWAGVDYGINTYIGQAKILVSIPIEEIKTVYENELTVDNYVAAFNAYLSAKPITIYYKLATPIDLELTEEQKEAKKINTYNNVTNIVADNELATLDVTYKKDQNTVNKNYEDRIAALEAAILS